MAPVCTIMAGRLDDWLKVMARKENICITPGHLDWAGIAAMKRAYGIFQERGYRARLLVAAYRHHMHWSELIGGDIILSIPYEWQFCTTTSDIEVKPRMQNPVDPNIVAELYRKFPDFRTAYDADGLSVEDFDRYGATVRTLRMFIASYCELLALVRDLCCPIRTKNSRGFDDQDTTADHGASHHCLSEEPARGAGWPVPPFLCRDIGDLRTWERGRDRQAVTEPRLPLHPGPQRAIGRPHGLRLCQDQ